MVNSYKDLIVWQKAIELVVIVYEVTESFPREEIYGLTSQLRRCAVSIPSNIAEGRFRGTKKDYLYFLRVAYGSGAEFGTQIEIAKRLRLTKHLNYFEMESLLDEVMKMLNVIIHKIDDSKS